MGLGVSTHQEKIPQVSFGLRGLAASASLDEASWIRTRSISILEAAFCSSRPSRERP